MSPERVIPSDPAVARAVLTSAGTTAVAVAPGTVRLDFNLQVSCMAQSPCSTVPLQLRVLPN